MSDPSLRPQDALLHAVRELRRRRTRFALVGGLAVSVRGEVRTTRDVDIAVAVAGDEELEALVADLAGSGYRVLATVEHEERGRLATVRLVSPIGFMVDLLAATSGIEPTRPAIPPRGRLTERPGTWLIGRSRAPLHVARRGVAMMMMADPLASGIAKQFPDNLGAT
jgi:hypothetical protein